MLLLSLNRFWPMNASAQHAVNTPESASQGQGDANPDAVSLPRLAGDTMLTMEGDSTMPAKRPLSRRS